MKFLNRKYRILILIIIVVILITGISVYATTTYLASQVTYKDGKSVEDALNELYNKENIPINEIWSSVSTSINYEHILNEDGLYITGIICANKENNTATINTNSTVIDEKSLANGTRTVKIKLINGKKNDTVFLRGSCSDGTAKANAFIYKLNNINVSEILNCSSLSVDSTSSSTYTATEDNSKILMVGFSCGINRSISVSFNGNIRVKGIQKNSVYIGYASLNENESVTINSYGYDWGTGVSFFVK